MKIQSAYNTNITFYSQKRSLKSQQVAVKIIATNTPTVIIPLHTENNVPIYIPSRPIGQLIANDKLDLGHIQAKHMPDLSSTEEEQKAKVQGKKIVPTFHLDLSGLKHDNTNLAIQGQLKSELAAQITTLSLFSNETMGKETMNFIIRQLPNLETLNIGHNKLSNLDGLELPATLTHLYLDNNPLKSFPASFFVKLPNLETLNLASSKYNGQGNSISLDYIIQLLQQTNRKINLVLSNEQAKYQLNQGLEQHLYTLKIINGGEVFTIDYNATK